MAQKNEKTVLKVNSQDESEQNTAQTKMDPPFIEKGEMSEFAKTAVIAVLLALLIRTFLYDPFNIPSGSMLPTLLVGDYLFVSKPAYGYSKHSFPFGLVDFEGRVMEEKPKRGDVVVFKLPSNPSIDYIKRVIGLPGETVQVLRGRLYINGELVEREPVGLVQSDDNLDSVQRPMMEYIETLPGGIMHRIYEESDNGELDNTIEYKIPENHYFMMGDNRDNSMDSRVSSLVGFVPFDNFVGRAEILFFSVEEKAQLFNPFSWPGTIRFYRMFDFIGPVRPKEELTS